MYGLGLCSSRFHLCFLPYASRKIISNSWIGSAQEIKTDVVIISDTDTTNSVVAPCRKHDLLPMIKSKAENTNNTSYKDKVFEWPVNRRQENGGYSDEFYDQLNFDMQSTLISFPIIYTSSSHLHLNTNLAYLDINLEELDQFGYGPILKSGKKEEECDPKKEKSKKGCDDKKPVGKGLKKLEKKGGSLFGKKKASPKKGKASKKAKKAKAPGGGFSWAAIEKKLPMWQNIIADILQKLQDTVFKNR